MNSRSTDRATLIYAFFVLIIIAVFRVSIPSFRYHLGFIASVTLFVLFMPYLRSKESPFRFIAYWYPLFLYTFFYYQTGLLNRLIVPDLLDPFFLDLDRAIFGEFPGFILNRVLGNGLISEYFHLSYFSYYLIIPGTALLIYRKDLGKFEKYVFQVSLLFYVCYFIYIFLPVEGPLNFREQTLFRNGIFKKTLDIIYRRAENPGAAFPSSHVAVTFLVAWWGSREFPRFKVLYWYLFLSLSLSTVYLMYHYAVDVAAGIILGISMLFIFKSFEREGDL